jgi:hypothetical protein
MMNKSLVATLLLISSCLYSLSVQASDLQDAVHAMREGNFAEAYCMLRPLAENGDADAQYNIGWMYLNGYGLRINDSLALEWWKRAAAQGHVDAHFSMGMLYSLGEGEVKKDPQKAIDNYLYAAQRGNDDAVSILKAMISRNDKDIRPRIHEIMNQSASLFGDFMKVKANKLNVRKGPSTTQSIVAQLVKDDVVLQLDTQGKWSQVVLIQDDSVDRAVWVYNPLLEPVKMTNKAVSG